MGTYQKTQIMMACQLEYLKEQQSGVLLNETAEIGNGFQRPDKQISNRRKLTTAVADEQRLMTILLTINDQRLTTKLCSDD